MENNTKLRPLFLARILAERTDEEHYLTTNQLIDILNNEFGIPAHRQTIAFEIKMLQQAGMDIDVQKSVQNRFRYIGRQFDIAELKLLIDAVDSSKFISPKRSMQLTEKLCALAGPYKATEFKRNILVEGKVKTSNEKVTFIIDAVNTAINRKRKISFLYFHYNEKKNKVYKNDGKPYIFSPYYLVWNGDYYYMVGWSDKHNKITTFRIDRVVESPEILDQKAAPKPKDFNINKHINEAFHMFDCDKEAVTLRCDNDMMDAIIDKFGENVKVKNNSNGTFEITETVAVSNVFYCWIFGFGGKVKIIKPDKIMKDYMGLKQNLIN
ncbi:MAG: WYL domain-containing protein [Parasporobacterium sp.]|nr:WYL domain-containing protein [Parasporobacterium sp.]